MSRTAELARCRAASALTEEDCLAWFGVGLATIERIEAGEINPEAELEHRIDRYLSAVGGGVSLSPPHSRPSFTQRDGLTGAGAAATVPAPSLGADFDGAPTQSNRGAQ